MCLPVVFSWPFWDTVVSRLLCGLDEVEDEVGLGVTLPVGLFWKMNVLPLCVTVCWRFPEESITKQLPPDPPDADFTWYGENFWVSPRAKNCWLTTFCPFSRTTFFSGSHSSLLLVLGLMTRGRLISSRRLMVGESSGISRSCLFLLDRELLLLESSSS